MYSKDIHLSNEANRHKMRLDNIQYQLQQIWLNLLNYATKWEYSYNRWKSIVTKMILKEAGDFCIHRLQVIHLYQADFSLLCGIFWQKILYKAMDGQQLNTDLYQMVLLCNAHMLPFMDTMMNKISQMSCKHLIKFDNNATSCYNRILVSLASLTSCSFGLPAQVTKLWASTQEQAQYKLKLNSNISNESYQHSQSTPIHGT